MKRRLVAATISIAALAGPGLYLILGKTPPITAVSAQTQSRPVLPTSKQVSDAFPAMGSPKRLAIAHLGVDAPVEPVGITDVGAMDIPDSLTTAGWYQHGAAPGNPGKAVLAAHTGYPKSPTIFRSLEHATVGLRIRITDQHNTVAAFEVIDVQRYSASSAPRDLIFGESPTARLAIITCTGTWDAAQNSYTDRLVLYAARTQ